MNEKEQCHYIHSVIYTLDQTSTYFRVQGTQFFNQLDIGVTLDQFVALDAIYCNEDICQRDLSKLILKDRSNTGRILNILEEKELIKRAIETKRNRMVKKIYITDKGKKVIEDNQERLRSTFLKTFEEVSEEELATLRQLLNKLKDCMSKFISIQI